MSGRSGGCRYIFPPTAAPGTMLELVQLAHWSMRFRSSRHSAAQRFCMRLAITHASILLATTVRDEQRGFVRVCPDPWSAVELWVRTALGQRVEQPRKSPRSFKRMRCLVRAAARQQRRAAAGAA